MNVERAMRSALEYYKSGKLEESENLCRKILRRQPKIFDVLHLLGFIRYLKNDYDSSIIFIERALAINSSSAIAHNDLGTALLGKGRIDDAIISFKKALQINSFYSDAYTNLGVALCEKGIFDEALEYYRKALKFNPNHADACNNLGKVLLDKGQVRESIQYFQKAILLKPRFAQAHLHLSLALLLVGDFRNGWKEYQWRWGLEEHRTPDFKQPLWDGSDLRNKTILLYAEQGLGDTIHFIRYAPAVAERGGKTILECQRELASLMCRVEGVHEVIIRGDRLPSFDLHCPLLGLPLVFSTTIESIPAKVPYIKADTSLVEKWRGKIQSDKAAKKVGLVWAGAPVHKKDRYRSCSLETFAPLGEIEGVSFYSLQKGDAAKEAKNHPGGMKLTDHTDEINDFSDTAALIETLDLVISVDTSVAHLAGAMGKMTWTLLPFAPDWRWMLNREDSPWYPTIRLFRQPSSGDWDSVIAKVKDELLKLLGSN
jgi:tetratricopeptide (TPR) repeat protein